MMEDDEEHHHQHKHLQRVDSLNLEAGKLSFSHTTTHTSKWGEFMGEFLLTIQCIGVVYGDLGTSPLYCYPSAFSGGIHHIDDILGVLSIIIYTIILIPTFKYVFIVLRANDNGDGGTFALYSLICRHVKASLIPNQEPEDRELSNYKLDTLSSARSTRSHYLKHKLESSVPAKIILLLVTILGTSMLIGDGILTPSISVLSAVSGISSSLSQNFIVLISVAILVALFCFQRFGTDKIGLSFGPILTFWFCLIAGIGIYNIFAHDIGVLRAFNPAYIIYYFNRNGKHAWISLGGIILCTTGTECMFADLGHFNVKAVQISFSGVVLPAILSTYMGQAAYLRKHPHQFANSFYASVPDLFPGFYWITFCVAVVAAIIASQSVISGAFSVISQSLSLGCFPRVKVVHTSSKYEGQVYIPEINYLLMISCVVVTLAFKSTEKIGNAYGIAVVSVMVITTCMVTLVMFVIWKMSIWWIALFFVVFISVEGLYLSSVLYKFTQGGFLPLAFSLVLMSIMGVWHYATKRRYMFELNNKVPTSYIRDIANNPKINRIPGIGLLYSEMVQGIPPIFPHFVENIPSIHSVLVFVSIKNILISKVAVEERFLFRQVEPREYRVYRCVVRYGYKDKIEEPKEFERQLVDNLKSFINDQYSIISQATEDGPNNDQTCVVEIEEEVGVERKGTGGEEEIDFVESAKEEGVVYLLGEAEVVAKQDSSFLNNFLKKAVVNYAYSFLRKNSRQGDKVLEIPRARLLRVGMTYEI